MMVDLIPGQYQIGSFLFGHGTVFHVEKFEVGGYDINVQDFQAVSSDELRFGSDSLKPLPIQLSINALCNRLLPNVAAIAGIPDGIDPSDIDEQAHVGSFAREWRADSTRKQWGALKPLTYCRRDFKTLQIFGRPGKLAVGKRTANGEYFPIVAEFRRSDTLCYTNFEWVVHPAKGAIVSINRPESFGYGDAPCWLRFLLYGPMNHPIIQLGFTTIELDYDIASGEVVEISSYPWSRRVIRASDGLSLNSKLVSPYLDQLMFNVNQTIQLSWTATGTSGGSYSSNPTPWPGTAYSGSQVLMLWRDAWNVIE